MKTVELATLTTTPGWNYDSPGTLQRLQVSLTRYGQLRPLIIRGTEVIKGRNILTAMLALGWTTGQAIELPDTVDARGVYLALEIDAPVDYSALAIKVTDLVRESNLTEVASASPFTTERVYYLAALTTFDWSQFGSQEQIGLFGASETLDEMEVKVAPVDLSMLRSELPEREEKKKAGDGTKRVKKAKPTRDPSPVIKPPTRHPVTPRDEADEIDDPWAGRLEPWTGNGPATSEFKDVPLISFGGGDELPQQTDWRPEAPISLEGIDSIELDTETSGLKWWERDRPIGISFRTPDGRCQYLPWGHAGGNLDEATVKRWAQTELRGKRITGANIRFDTHMLRAWGVDLEEQGCEVSDVMHYAALLDDHRRKFSLDALARTYLGVEKTGKELDTSRMADYHSSIVAPRAEDDVRLTGQLKTVMWAQMDEQDLQRVRALEDKIIYPVCEMERNAAPIDRELLKQYVVESEREYFECIKLVTAEVGFQVNPERGEDWQRIFKRFNIEVTHRTEGGAPSFSDEALKNIENPWIQLLRRARKYASLRSKFILPYDAAVGDDRLLRFSLHQLRNDEHGTVRGRFSASDKNIQQVMSTNKQIKTFGSEQFLIRQLFVPGSGLFLSADAQQIEYRLFAHFSEAPFLLKAYAENPETNFHTVVQGMVQPFREIDYVKTKILNFMKIYGGGREKAAALLELPLAESNVFIDIYDRTFPEAKVLLGKASNLARSRGYVRTILGRRARFPDKKFAHAALNAVIQGSAADIMKQKLIEVHAERKATGFVMRMTVHDEVCGDAPNAESAAMVGEILNRQSFALKVPILWEVKTGANWAGC